MEIFNYVGEMNTLTFLNPFLKLKCPFDDSKFCRKRRNGEYNRYCRLLTLQVTDNSAELSFES